MRKAQDKEAQEKEDPKLRHVVMPTQRDQAEGPKKEEPHLTAAERAEKEREPVRYHFCVMQRDQDMLVHALLMTSRPPAECESSRNASIWSPQDQLLHEETNADQIH